MKLTGLILVALAVMGCGGGGSSAAPNSLQSQPQPVDSIVVKYVWANSADLAIGGSPYQLTFKAANIAGKIIPVAPSAAVWQIVSGASISLTPGGLTAPLSIGATTVKAVVHGATCYTGTVYVGNTSFVGVYTGSYVYKGASTPLTMVVATDGSFTANSTTTVAYAGSTNWSGSGTLSSIQPSQATAEFALDYYNGLLYIDVAIANGTISLSNGTPVISGTLEFGDG